ncbi:MAG: biopolymer transporter ExbD [Deltaproteobacteria bacterium]|nr:biopolymer transporter ExbD [Deltaproteobacteria bacterium]
MDFSIKKKHELHIDVINMVDVFLNLLIFFMLSTSFISSPGIKINLPHGKGDVIIKPKGDIRLYIDAKGAIFFDKKQVDIAELKTALESAAKTAPDTLVIIAADKDVLHGRVVQVMEAARSAGLHKLAIATTEQVNAP